MFIGHLDHFYLHGHLYLFNKLKTEKYPFSQPLSALSTQGAHPMRRVQPDCHTDCGGFCLR